MNAWNTFKVKRTEKSNESKGKPKVWTDVFGCRIVDSVVHYDETVINIEEMIVYLRNSHP